MAQKDFSALPSLHSKRPHHPRSSAFNTIIQPPSPRFPTLSRFLFYCNATLAKYIKQAGKLSGLNLPLVSHDHQFRRNSCSSSMARNVDVQNVFIGGLYCTLQYMFRWKSGNCTAITRLSRLRPLQLAVQYIMDTKLWNSYPGMVEISMPGTKIGETAFRRFRT